MPRRRLALLSLAASLCGPVAARVEAQARKPSPASPAQTQTAGLTALDAQLEGVDSSLPDTSVEHLAHGVRPRRRELVDSECTVHDVCAA
jgi:hypothetical protein